MPGHGSGLFRQTHLIASGAQNWISQPLVAQDKQFAYASTLAVYVYNNEDQQLQKVSAPSRGDKIVESCRPASPPLDSDHLVPRTSPSTDHRLPISHHHRVRVEPARLQPHRGGDQRRHD